MVAPQLEVVEQQIVKALDEAGVMPEEVTVVLRTGGSSQLSAFGTMLDRMFGVEKVRKRPPFTTVAYGLGVVAQKTWL